MTHVIPTPPGTAMTPARAVAVAGEPQVLRFTRLNRILHISMIVSFISLALTGLTLKFSYSWWAGVVSRFFGGFESAGYIHRSAAVVMFGVFIAHLVDVAKMKKREQLSLRQLLFGPGSMLFNRKDLQDFVENVRGSTPAKRMISLRQTRSSSMNGEN